MKGYDPDEMRRKFWDDPLRPKYHFTPPANWLNDPNGLIQWKGTYHLFYQHNPNEPRIGNIHWGHAKSKDLIHWEDMPLALEPNEKRSDGDGCWTGCVVLDDNVPTAVYTGWRNNFQRQMIAVSLDDDLVSWEKDPANPVISGSPIGIDPTNIRDPFVWKEEDKWKMLLGVNAIDKGPAVLMYKSVDLRQWHYVGMIYLDEKREKDSVWECPGIIKFNEKSLIYGSLNDKFLVEYRLGNLNENNKFEEDSRGILDAGDFYAPQVFTDDKNRNIMFGWITEARDEEEQVESGWSGSMSIPRIISLDSESKLKIKPVPEVKKLRSDNKYRNKREKIKSSSKMLPMRGSQVEIKAEFENIDATRFGFSIFESSDGKECTDVEIDRKNGKLIVDRSESTLNTSVDKSTQEALLDLAQGKSIMVNMFLDHSIVEIFVNDIVSLTSRIYPSKESSDGISIFAKDGSVELSDIHVWEMKSSWPKLDKYQS